MHDPVHPYLHDVCVCMLQVWSTCTCPHHVSVGTSMMRATYAACDDHDSWQMVNEDNCLNSKPTT